MSSLDPSVSGAGRFADDSHVDDDSAVVAFQRAWQQGPTPVLEEFVAKLSDISPRDLAVLIQIDLDARWGRNDLRRPEDYFQCYPSVAADVELAVDVIYAEYLARERVGERPDLTEYQERFPELADVLTAQLNLHVAMEVLDNDMPDEPDETESIASFSSQMSGQPSRQEASYEILEQIGRGGMGVVYKARQPGLNRFVALKMVRAIDATNEELLARFRSEARVVAALDHPHIVQVYDYGEHDGLPYLAMELVEGGSLADRLDGTPWPARVAAELMSRLAGAVSFAHEHRVVHRDLKPANVLIVSDEKPLEVKITDFGLAKFCFEESSLLTKSNAFFGTPSYMAPEQASGRRCDIGPASDLYALGAILYELLTGRPPIRGDSPMETLRLLLSTEPVSIHRVAPRIPRDLATICDKCLSGEIDRRYASAAELRDDLERYLSGKPIRARAVGPVERTWRWCRRNPLLAGAAGSVIMLLAGIAAVSLWYSAQLSRELGRSQLAESSERSANLSAQHRLWDAHLSEAAALNGSHQVGQRFAALDMVDKAAVLLDTVGHSKDRDLQLRSAVLSSVALSDMRPARRLGPWPETGYACDLSVAANCYVVATENGIMTGYRLSDNERLWVVECSKSDTPVLSRDGRFVAVVGDGGTTLWRVDETRPRAVWQDPQAQFFTFAPVGLHAAYSHPADGMHLVDFEEGGAARPIGTGPANSQFAFAPSSGRIAVCGDTTVQVIRADTGQVESEIPLQGNLHQRIAWHPDGRHLAVWTNEAIVLWDVDTHTKMLSLPHFGIPAHLSFNQDGSMLASHTLWDQRLLLWDIGAGQRILDVPDFICMACDVGPQGQLVFLAPRGDDVTLKEVAAGTCRALSRALHAPLSYWHHASAGPEGRIIAFSGSRGFELWDMQTTQRLYVLPLGNCTAHFDSAGQLILGCEHGLYRLPRRLEKVSGAAAEPTVAMRLGPRTIIQLGPAEKIGGPIVPTSLAINASGETLVFEDDRGWALMHLNNDSSTTRLHTRGDPRKSAISNDSRYAAVANWESGGVTVWNGQSGAHLADLEVGRCGVPHFSPDGRFLAATPDGVTLWSTGDWRRTASLHGAERHLEG